MDTIVGKLLEHDWGINEKQRHRRGVWTLLHYFVQRGFTQAVSCFLLQDASPNLPDNRGRMLLHVVARKGSGKQIVNLLVVHGADINAHDHNNQRPLDYVEKAKIKTVICILKELNDKHGRRNNSDSNRNNGERYAGRHQAGQ